MKENRCGKQYVRHSGDLVSFVLNFCCLGRRQVLLEQVGRCHESQCPLTDMSLRFLQSRFMDVSISDPQNDVSRGVVVA